jgi:hypothetical protein
VGLAWPALEAIGYELSPTQGYMLLSVMGALFVGMVIALLWPDSRSNVDVEAQKKYRTVKTLLGQALIEGRSQRSVINYGDNAQRFQVADKKVRHNWISNTFKLIEEALSRGDAEYFRGNKGDAFEDRLKRLEKLITGLTLADVNLDFDPQEWNN